jgi:NO-binding membrane sensor protein with MHYT domain
MAQAEYCSEHSGFESRMETLENSDSRQWDAIERLQSRLPVWATLFISFLTFLLGAAIAKIVI